MDLYIGTSGYNYKEWKGPFYPEKFPDKEMLDYYGQRFNSVEINNSFYRVPKPDVVVSWGERVPGNFRFSMKATRRITHLKRLKGVEEETGYFIDIVSNLGPGLGALLFQLPPTLRKDMDRLRTFLEILPDGAPAAMEFRHESWFDDEVKACLQSKNVALCFAHEDEDTAEETERRFASTASWGYLRLRGSGYGDDELRAWADRVKGQSWERAFVFFKHESEGLGPKLARRFAQAAQVAGDSGPEPRE